MRDDSEPGRRFRAVYDTHFEAILAYALRRVAAQDAGDVVAETFLVAWRRIEEVPAGDDARLWLYGVARRVLANHLRGEGRRTRLGDRLRNELSDQAVSADPADDIIGRRMVRSAMAQLRDLDRELLELAIWEQLEPREIAVALELSGTVVRTRLKRARTRLRELLEDPVVVTGHDPAPPGHVRSVRTRLVPKEDR